MKSPWGIPWWSTLAVQNFRAERGIKLHKCGECCICFAELCPCDWCKFVNSAINRRVEKVKA